jgi:large subunit ribosomal protein L10
MRMPTLEKTELVAEIKERFNCSEAVIMIDYRGLTVKEMQELRSKIRASGAEAKIYKNTLTEIAIRELGLVSMDEFLAGPTAFVFASGDPVGPAKVLQAFAKEHKALEIKGGFVQNQLVDAAGMKAIASLPSREELIAKLMGMMTSPVRGFMAMANAPAGAFVRVVKAVADQKAAA